MHVVELAVVLLAAWFVVTVLLPQVPGVGEEVVFGIIAIVVGALAKFARANKRIPLPDYVEKADDIIPL